MKLSSKLEPYYHILDLTREGSIDANIKLKYARLCINTKIRWDITSIVRALAIICQNEVRSPKSVSRSYALIVFFLKF